MNFLITGGAGFIGSHLCKTLIKQGNKVTCIDNFDNFYNPEIKRDNIKELISNNNFSLVEGDIRNEKDIEKCFTEKIDFVVHLAAKAGVRPSIDNPDVYYDVNITRNIKTA